jgi:ribosome maturation factor RimP
MLQQITTLVQAYLENDKFFIVDIEVVAGKKDAKVVVLLDSDEGIGIYECAEISRKLGKDIEDANLFEEAYNLEVSSPGVDFPLSSKRQYLKNIGRNLKVKLKDGTEKTGKLEAVNDDTIALTEEVKKQPKKKEQIAEPLVIILDQIQQSKVQISFK